MDERAERYRTTAATFATRISEVPADAWDNDAPCEGWVARDVVRHLVEWVPDFFMGTLAFPPIPSVDDDPAAAWAALDSTLQAALDDPDLSEREFDMRAGRHSIARAIDTFITPDVLIHTWDLARATGLDETLDADQIHAIFEGMEPTDAMLRESGHFGPRVPISDDADEQSKVLAFFGRQP